MVKAYTLQDKIVQQGFNDFESFVGLVFKKDDGESTKRSSLNELQASGATQISVGQVAAAICDDNSLYDTYGVTELMLSDPDSSPVLSRVMNAWAAVGKTQYVVIRRLDSFPVIDPSSPLAPVAICYKVVVDAYLAPVAP